MLGQDVHWRFGNSEAVEVALANREHECSAFQQVVARGGEEAAFRERATPMPRAADPLEGCGNVAGGTDLANQVNAPDINAEFERSGCHQRADFPGLQFSFSSQTQLARQAAVVGGDRVFSQSFAEMMRHALGQPARVDKDKRGTMLGGKRRDAIVNLIPHFVRCHGSQLAAGNFDGQIEFAPMADLHNFRGDVVCASQKTGHEFDRLLRCGKANARKAFSGQMIEAFER